MSRYSFSLVAVPLLTATMLGCGGQPSDGLNDVPIANAQTALSQKASPAALDVCLKPGSPHGEGEAIRETPGGGTAEKKRSWPCNGYLVNNYSAAVQIWSDYVYGTIAAHSTSDRFNDDVDFVLSPCSGTWLKIGPFDAVVEPTGCVWGYLREEDPPKP